MVNLVNTTQVETGTYSLSFTAESPWAGLRLHAGQPVDLSIYNTLTFSTRGTTDNQSYAVILYTGGNLQIGQTLMLANYGGNPTSTAWKTYTIPLADFGGDVSTISDIVIQSFSDSTQPAVYLDQIILKK